jgi:hypothetical protein
LPALEKPGHSTVASRLAIFPALPGDKRKRHPNHHRVILALSTAFRDAWLREDNEARAWLDPNGTPAIHV